jgi:hypothetical protein
MGAATAVAAGVAIAGVATSVAGAVKQSKLEKQAKRDAQIAMQKAQAITESNPFSSLKVPTVANKLAMDQINQAGADSVDALQGAGAEAVLGGIPGVNRAINGAQLDVAANQNQAQFNRDVLEKNAQMDINQRDADRKYALEMTQFSDANQKAVDVLYAKNQNIASAFSSASQGIGALSGTDIGVYENSLGGKRKKKKKKPLTNEEIDQLING